MVHANDEMTPSQQDEVNELRSELAERMSEIERLSDTSEKRAPKEGS